MNKKLENNQKNQRIQVFARCRPLNALEKKQYSPPVVEVIPEKKIVVKDRNANREFFFDKVFPPDTKQISVYKAVVGPLIQEVLMGYNCTVFAYGQTGTGKTYTMEGERSNSKCSWEDDPGAGIIPRSLHQLFEDLNKEENVEFSVRVSFLELYNEELFDLLSSTELSRLRLFEDSSKKGSVIIQGLEEIIVNSRDEVYSILERGTARRQTAATMLNATSSRSHTVFSVTVHIKENTIEGEELLKTGKLNLVDLAGSENVGRSGAVDKRAREAGNINQSLLTLGRVITALIEKQPHVPYRESKLTRLLQDSLGGHTKTSIIATISPAQCNFDETISTLDYATKAKSITIKPEVNQKMTKRALIREYTEEIERLRKDLVASRSKEGVYMDTENYHALCDEMNEKDATVKDLREKIELLKEENSKIEEIFKVTKEELTSTHEKLNEAQKILVETARKRDENQFLINIHYSNEKKLSQQAKKLLDVADESTNDVEKLHAKIHRKVTVEKTNEEKCAEFRSIYQEKFALLDKLLSDSEKQQATNLLGTKKDIDIILQALHSHHKNATDFLNTFLSEVMSNTRKISANFIAVNDNQVKWTNSLFGKLNSEKEQLLKKQYYFLEELPKFMNKMNAKSCAIQDWICNVHKQISHKIETEKNVLCEKSKKRKELQNSVQNSLNSLCNSYDSILKEFKIQSSNICTLKNELNKDFEGKLNEAMEKLNDLHVALGSLEKFPVHQKELERNISKRDNLLITSIEQNSLKMVEEIQKIAELSDGESAVEEDVSNLNQILAEINVDEFSREHNSLRKGHKEIIAECEKFIKQTQKEEESILSEAESSYKSHLLSVSQDMESVNMTIIEMNSSLEESVHLQKISDKDKNEEIQKHVQKVSNDVTESRGAQFSVSNQLKDVFQKMDFDLKKFIPDGFLKDVPTGTTPQRKNYTYPRVLTATSPHDRILERYRSKLVADTAIAVNLPLNSSFNELEESTNKSTDVLDTNNESLSSDDSTSNDTDSCASSVSDASIGKRNKENWKYPKKRSRLPKKLPNKGFVKPALPLKRKPLGVSNSKDTESFAELP